MMKTRKVFSHPVMEVWLMDMDVLTASTLSVEDNVNIDDLSSPFSDIF